MKLSNTSKYAIRVLTYMAKHKEEQRITAKGLSETLSIPYKFLTKIMTALVKEGLIRSIRGREGGYAFAKETTEIKINDILEIFNDAIADEECILGIGFCNQMCQCALHEQWLHSKIALQKMFKESSIEILSTKGTKI